jgi:hypothetical protein
MNKKVRCINSKDSNGKLVEGEIYKVIDEYGRFYDLEGVDMSDWYISRFEDVVEDEEIERIDVEMKYKVGDTVRIAKVNICFDEEFVGRIAKIAEIDEDGDYFLEGIDIVMFEEQLELAEEPKPEEKYPVIEKFKGFKVVFNPPYTIVQYEYRSGDICEGKAKCSPSDVYDKWTGFKIAKDRMRNV